MEKGVGGGGAQASVGAARSTEPARVGLVGAVKGPCSGHARAAGVEGSVCLAGGFLRKGVLNDEALLLKGKGWLEHYDRHRQRNT